MLRELGFFDIYPADDNPSFNGAWTSYPFFSSGVVAINGIEQGLFLVRPRMAPTGVRSGLTVTLSGPHTAAYGEDLVFVARVANEGPDRRSGIRLLEMPPTGAELVSVRSSQGACSMSAVAACEIGNLAPGSDAFIVLTVRTTREGDRASSVVVSGSSDDRVINESHTADMTTTIVRHTPSLTMHRPSSDTVFRLGRNNTVQWTLRGVRGGVAIDLSRDDGATWTRLTDEAVNVGFYDWTGTELPTSRARIRITSLANPALTETSPGFSILAR
jgi:hypothetical protein